MYPESSPKDNPGPSIRNSSHTKLANATLVSSVDATSESTPDNSASINRYSQAQVISRNSSPSPQEAGTAYLSCIREKLSQQGLFQDAVTIILASWRDGTKSPYQTHLLKWFAYCEDKSCNILSPSVAVALDFLANLFYSGLSFSSINTARSALLSILQVNNNSLPFGQLPVVQKGIYDLHPSFPKYTSVWDLKTVLDYFRSQPSASDDTERSFFESYLFIELIKWTEMSENTSITN